MIRAQDVPYIEVVKSLAGRDVTSAEIDQAVYKVNQANGFTTVRTGRQVITIMQFLEIIDIQSHLGQPRHGSLINGGRLHTFSVREI